MHVTWCTLANLVFFALDLLDAEFPGRDERAFFMALRWNGEGREGRGRGGRGRERRGREGRGRRGGRKIENEHKDISFPILQQYIYNSAHFTFEPATSKFLLPNSFT